jgi:polyprenyl-phospho-N-acetylgalactosaminyl synthase
MVSALERTGADVALGSRFLGDAIDMPRARRLLLRLAILFTWLTEGVRLTDAHNGLRVFRAAAAQRVRIRHDGMAHASEVIEQMVRNGLTFVEVPTTVRYTAYSRAKGQRAAGSLGIVIELLTGKLR